MNILYWTHFLNKPKKKQSTEDWKKLSADGAPPGVYTPNMSVEDAAKWKAKLVGTRKDKPQIEIRKTIEGTQLVLIVSKKGGFSYGNKFARSGNEAHPANIHLSANGPIRFTWDQLAEFNQAVEEARDFLNKEFKETQ